MRGFRFDRLAVVQYFLHCLAQASESVIPKELWNQAKRQTLDSYAGGSRPRRCNTSLPTLKRLTSIPNILLSAIP
ncbi:MAG: hypothetical protein J5641_05240 [Bacteroidales bacterium]|nr:hypothetical protein [Bacteroidales bacterium]